MLCMYMCAVWYAFMYMCPCAWYQMCKYSLLHMEAWGIFECVLQLLSTLSFEKRSLLEPKSHWLYEADQRASCPASASPGWRLEAWSCYMGTGDPDSQPYIFSGTTWWVGNISPSQTWVFCKFFERKMLTSFLSPFKGGVECQWSVNATTLATEMFCGGHHMLLQPRILFSCR